MENRGDGIDVYCGDTVRRELETRAAAPLSPLMSSKKRFSADRLSDL
jgi:hypothetical protein